LAKVPLSATERNDPEGIHPLFDHDTGEVIGEQRYGKLIFFDKNRNVSQTPIIDSLMNGTDFPAPISKSKSGPREKSLTQLFGGPL
jgi:hypothetical protein